MVLPPAVSDFKLERRHTALVRPVNPHVDLSCPVSTTLTMQGLRMIKIRAMNRTSKQ